MIQTPPTNAGFAANSERARRLVKLMLVDDDPQAFRNATRDIGTTGHNLIVQLVTALVTTVKVLDDNPEELIDIVFDGMVNYGNRIAAEVNRIVDDIDALDDGELCACEQCEGSVP